MKKILLLIGILALSFTANARIVTSAANGNATNPFSWDCTCIPIDGDTINIIHAITLDVDYAFTMGGIHIFSNGSVTGDINQRIFGVSGGFFINEGTMTMGYIAHNGGTFVNQGTITALGSLLIDQAVTFVNNNMLTASDSLLVNTNATLQNSGGTISTGEFLSAGTITNTANGSITCLNLFSTGTVTDNGAGIHTLMSLYNTGTMVLNGFTNIDGDVWNAENITIGSYMEAQSLWNGDTINGTAMFTNNGTVSLSNSLYNSEDISGTGDFCVADSSTNSGAVTGTVDICDQTGGGWDLNIGTEAGTVTHCASGPCSIGIQENETGDLRVVPNPATENISMQLPAADAGTVSVIDVTGRVVLTQVANTSLVTIDISSLNCGVYTILYSGSQFQYNGVFVKE